MINGYRLLHPSRYVPILLAALAVAMLVPADGPPDDGPEAAASAGAALAVATERSVTEEPAVKIAEVSRKPEPQPVAAVAPPVSKAAPPASPAPQSGSDTDANQDNQPAAAPPETAPAVDEPPPDAAEATPDEDASAGAYQIARVGGSALNVRAGPSSNNQKLFVLRPGEPVRVAEIEGGWARIVRADGDEGWAFARYLTGLHGDAVMETTQPSDGEQVAKKVERSEPKKAADKPPAKPESSSAERSRYARMGSNVAARSAPSAGAPQIFVLPAGSRVRITEIRGPWAQVVTDSGVSGWVRYR